MAKTRIYYLPHCGTCKKVLASLNTHTCQMINIKDQPITEAELEEMKDLAGSYAALFSKYAQNYKKMGLKDKALSEEDMKSLILSDYTFLKRPVILKSKSINIGNPENNPKLKN
ncbi:MAG TPA: ArsC/Spx/MgsR family protein [Saprospiraceae bacterium]|nr:ArsC/Spx/MgsR family protein [Saprospiraceae bacterium]